MLYTNTLRELRTQRKMTLRQLADETYISKSCLGAIELGKEDMRVSTLVILAKYFDCHLEDVIKF